MFVEIATKRPCSENRRIIAKKLSTDSYVAILISSYLGFTSRTKCIELRFRFIGKLAASSTEELEKGGLVDLLAGALTKHPIVRLLQHMLYGLDLTRDA